MSSRELIALGTSSQAPTRERSHNAYLLRWDGEGFLMDPGEGAQRQLTLAGVPASAIHNILITHFHGDHCLGLPGIIQRLSLDRCDHPVHLYYPESGAVYIARLCNASVYHAQVEVILHPIKETNGSTELVKREGYSLMAHPLRHSCPTIGFRVEEPMQLRFDPEALDRMGVHGAMVGELSRSGAVEIAGQTIRLEDVTFQRQGNVFAFVMDTRPCNGAVELARDADLLLMESTYSSEHRELAELYLHSTAEEAAQTAREAGAQQLALTHFSQRYPDASRHLADSQKIFQNTIALNDFDRVEIKRRRSQALL